MGSVDPERWRGTYRGDENIKKWVGWPTVALQCVSELKNDYFTSAVTGSEGLSDAPQPADTS